MSRASVLSYVVVIGGAVVALSTSATSQSAFKNYVALQPVTPGVSQSGNLNVSGRVQANNFLGSGANLSNLNASAITSGLLSAARGGLGTDTSGSADGSLLTFNGTAWVPISPGTEGEVLLMGASTPTWGAAPGLSLPVNLESGSSAPDALFKITNLDSGPAIWGENTVDGGIGVKGSSLSATGFSFGGRFEVASPDARAISAYNFSATGTSVAGRFGTPSPDGIAVWATAGSATGNSFGVFGESLSDSGTGVFGYGTLGVYGLASGNWAGVYGKLNDTPSIGLSGGVFGEYDFGGNGNAVFAWGRTVATGTKSFIADYPLDPENYVLYHYCTESDKPTNSYRGTARTDAKGYAIVALPEYFDSINIEATVQLTVVDSGDDFVQAKVSQRPSNGQFVIRTSQPNTEVDWRIEATRNDAYVRTHGAPTVVEKDARTKGKYLNPEFFGQPRSMGVFYGWDQSRPQPRTN